MAGLNLRTAEKRQDKSLPNHRRTIRQDRSVPNRPLSWIRDATAAYKRGDYAMALRLFKPQAERGNALAQGMLGIMYDEGVGLRQDVVRAHLWLTLAEDRGVESGGKVRDIIARRMTVDQISAATRLARKWKPKQ